MLWTNRHRKLAPAIIASVCTVICLLLYWAVYCKQYVIVEQLQRPENYLRDLRAKTGRMAPRDPRLLFLAIDDTSYQLEQASAVSESEVKNSPALQLMVGGFPYPRNFYPLLLDKLFGAGARVVIFDLVFMNETAADPAFKAALDKYRDRVVIGWNFIEGEAGQSWGYAAIAGTYQFPSESLIKQTTPLDDRLGDVNYWADSADKVTRAATYHPRFKGDPETYDSLAMRVVSKLGITPPVPVDSDRYLFRWTGWNDATLGIDTGFRAYPIYEIFVPVFWKNNYKNGELFRDKIVLVGAKGNFTKDELLTPFGIMPGPEVHLNALNALLHGEFLHETGHFINFFLIISAGVLACAILYWSRSPGKTFLFFVGCTIVYFALAEIFYNEYNTYILMFFPSLCFVSSGLLGFTNEFIGEQIERRRTRATLERYVSKNLVSEILDNPETFYNKVGGVRLPITALFSDVRDFTTMAEEADPTEMVAQLNEYLQEMTRIVFEFDGTLDKFVGDAVMAVWGNIQTVGAGHDADNAVRAALAMLESLRQLNERWRASGRPQWLIGIGINQGEAIAGNIGSNEKMDLTVIGDAVNTASRLEGLTKKYRIPLLIGPAVADKIRDRFHLRSVDRATAKGKANALDLFTVLGEKKTPLTAEESARLESYEEAVRLFRRKSFNEALEQFESLLKQQPGDTLVQMYVERCRAFIQNPPPENWNGAAVFTEK